MDVILVKPKEAADVTVIMNVLGQIKGIDSCKIFKGVGDLVTIKAQISKDIADALFKEV